MRNTITDFAARFLLSLAFVTVLGSVVALANDTPMTVPGATTVDAAKAKSLMESGIIMIDTRVAKFYAESHIKGAVNVPYNEKSAQALDFDASLDSFDVSKLPADKSAAIIFSCNGPECWKSYKAIHAAVKAGYKTLYWMRGGYPEWKAKGFPVE